MSFWAQIRLPDDPERMAYLFVDRNGDLIDPVDTSVFIQPGGAPSVSWVAEATGPMVPDRTEEEGTFSPPRPWSFTARVPSLDHFTEPVAWEPEDPIPHRSQNKVGGTPAFFQGAPDISHDHVFLCQFGAYEAGEEIGDRAYCYLFVDPVSGGGQFIWDSH